MKRYLIVGVLVLAVVITAIVIYVKTRKPVVVKKAVTPPLAIANDVKGGSAIPRTDLEQLAPPSAEELSQFYYERYPAGTDVYSMLR